MTDMKDMKDMKDIIIQIKMKKYILRKNIIDENCIYIFTHGYCGNFVKVLQEYLPQQSLGYIYNKEYNDIDHWFLHDKNMINYYDINGKQTINSIIQHIYGKNIPKIDICHYISLEEYENIGLWTDNDNYLVYQIIDEYINLYDNK